MARFFFPVSKGLGGESLKGDKPQLLGEVIKFGKASNLISLLRIKHVYMCIYHVPTEACKQTEWLPLIFMYKGLLNCYWAYLKGEGLQKLNLRNWDNNSMPVTCQWADDQTIPAPPSSAAQLLLHTRVLCLPSALHAFSHVTSWSQPNLAYSKLTDGDKISLFIVLSVLDLSRWMLPQSECSSVPHFLGWLSKRQSPYVLCWV